jgi:UDP-3-O-[3-hydroxymyristoyl] glucosamine N-acyltransferase
LPTYTLEHLASALGGSLLGDGSLVVSGLAPLSEARPGQLSFLASRRYLDQALATAATAVIVSEDFSPNGRSEDAPALLMVADPYAAYAAAAELFQEPDGIQPGVHPTAVVEAGARLAPRVSVGAHAVIGAGAELGDGVHVGAGCFVAPGVRVGSGTRLFPRVVLLPGTIVGERCILQSGAVVGSDGFGYASTPAGHRRIPQLGSVRIEADVEIGANCTIDRGSLSETRIGRGSKLDNLVHVAHNVDVGEHVLLVAQVGVSGSTRIGDRAVLAGQVGVVGHIQVGAGARIGAQSGVTKSVPAGEEWFGYPARERQRAFRLQALQAKLPELFERLRRLEARFAALEEER